MSRLGAEGAIGVCRPVPLHLAQQDEGGAPTSQLWRQHWCIQPRKDYRDRSPCSFAPCSEGQPNGRCGGGLTRGLRLLGLRRSPVPLTVLGAHCWGPRRPPGGPWRVLSPRVGPQPIKRGPRADHAQMTMPAFTSAGTAQRTAPRASPLTRPRSPGGAHDPLWRSRVTTVAQGKSRGVWGERGAGLV